MSNENISLFGRQEGRLKYEKIEIYCRQRQSTGLCRGKCIYCPIRKGYRSMDFLV